MVSDPNECTFQKSLPTAVNSFNSDCANVRSTFSTSTIRVTHYIFKLSAFFLSFKLFNLPFKYQTTFDNAMFKWFLIIFSLGAPNAWILTS